MAPDQVPDVLDHGSERPERVPRWVRTLAAVVAVAGAVGWYVARDDPAGPSSQDLEAEAPRAAASLDRFAEPVFSGDKPAGLADRESRDLARTMRRFAHDPGPAAGMPWAPRVLVLAEGPVAVNKVVTAAVADRLTTWTDPPYLLSPLASALMGRIRIDDDHHVTCRGSPRMQAPGFEGREWVSLQPRVLDNMCRGWWAVDLYLDDRGRVDAVLLRS
jgi:hypothetical protein